MTKVDIFYHDENRVALDNPNSERGYLICMDCIHHGATQLPNPIPREYVCSHWLPAYWKERGWISNWGDAAVSNWPFLEILRKETIEDGKKCIKYLILAPLSCRRPVEIWCSGSDINSWGHY